VRSCPSSRLSKERVPHYSVKLTSRASQGGQRPDWRPAGSRHLTHRLSRASSQLPQNRSTPDPFLVAPIDPGASWRVARAAFPLAATAKALARPWAAARACRQLADRAREVTPPGEARRSRASPHTTTAEASSSPGPRRSCCPLSRRGQGAGGSRACQLGHPARRLTAPGRRGIRALAAPKPDDRKPGPTGQGSRWSG
jgi:hypothetical protein